MIESRMKIGWCHECKEAIIIMETPLGIITSHLDEIAVKKAILGLSKAKTEAERVHHE